MEQNSPPQCGAICQSKHKHTQTNKKKRVGLQIQTPVKISRRARKPLAARRSGPMAASASPVATSPRRRYRHRDDNSPQRRKRRSSPSPEADPDRRRRSKASPPDRDRRRGRDAKPSEENGQAKPDREADDGSPARRAKVSDGEEDGDRRRRRARVSDDEKEGDRRRRRSRASDDERDDRRGKRDRDRDSRRRRLRSPSAESGSSPDDRRRRRHRRDEGSRRRDERRRREDDREERQKGNPEKREPTPLPPPPPLLPEMIPGRTGGIYIPPFRMAQMMRDVEDKSSPEYQRLTWDALKKSINGLVNKVNGTNIKNIVPELLAENLVRGRGLFCQSCMKSQMASPGFTDVFSALVAVVNTKFPEIGRLLLVRVVLQLKRAYKRNDKVSFSSLSFTSSRDVLVLIVSQVFSFKIIFAWCSVAFACHAIVLAPTIKDVLFC
jgi:pre-mRNA-splicing factor CWC22